MNDTTTTTVMGAGEAEGSSCARVIHHDGAVVVRLTGDLEAADATGLRNTIWPLLGRYESDMVAFDCADLVTIDPACLVALVQFARAITPGPTEMQGLAPDLRDAIRSTGHASLFDFERISLH